VAQRDRKTGLPTKLLDEIEETQAGLRHSIKVSRALVEETQRLLDRHRRARERPAR